MPPMLRHSLNKSKTGMDGKAKPFRNVLRHSRTLERRRSQVHKPDREAGRQEVRRALISSLRREFPLQVDDRDSLTIVAPKPPASGGASVHLSTNVRRARISTLFPYSTPFRSTTLT